MSNNLHCCLIILVSLLTLQSASAQDRPNVLMIIVDDLRPIVGAYGNPLIHTPNIDRLANSGFVFEHAFASVPVCGASRASLFSGLKPTTNRFLYFDSRLDRDLPDAVSLPALFRQNGYTTLASGKVFDDTEDSASAWSESVWSPSGDWNSPNPPDSRGEYLQKAYLNNPAGQRGPAYERLNVADTDYPDGKLAEKAINDIKRFSDSNAPFFMAVGFRKPHLPFNVPERYWAIYDDVDFSLPATYRERSPGTPAMPYHRFFELRAYAGIPAEGPVTDEQALTMIHGYHAAVSYADAQVGKVLDTLESEGLADNTIVVLLGDHGYQLGDHTQWTKHSLFDIALHSPLIIRDPKRGSGRISHVVSFIDIFPTLTELTGLPDSQERDGYSLVSAMDNPDGDDPREIFSRWINGLSVRTNQFRYTEWLNEDDSVIDRMLFDLQADPDETRNLAEDPSYAEVVQQYSESISENDSNSPWSDLVRRLAPNGGP